jgi:hypothetical protein|nr:MAG TPA: hypothetical protein [Caudoviricetes sp.]
MDENIRFIELIDALKSNGIIADYVQISKELKTNKAGISDIKSGRKKLSIEMLRRMKLSYPQTNIEWVIMGVGDMLLSTTSEKDKVQTSGIEERLLSFIQEKDNVIREQAEEIGQLRERIAQMQQRFEKDAANANTDTIADVG